jgi:peptidoglycan/xylan/chitin deacetylase (PgdA/CDA1 family)
MMKDMARHMVHTLLASEPIAGFARKIRLAGGAVALMYHEVAEDDADIEAWTVVRQRDFLNQMDYLGRHFTIVSLGEALESMSGHSNGASMRRPLAVVTFDDGYAGNRRVLLPLIQARNIPVTIFVATRAIQEQTLYWYDRLINRFQDGAAVELDLAHLALGRYRINHSRGAGNWSVIETLLSDLKQLEPQQRANAVDAILARLPVREAAHRHEVGPLSIEPLRELAASPLVTIGAHSHCHNILTQLPESAVRDSLATSKRLLESWTGQPVRYFAYPNGDYNASVASLVKSAGFECAMTTVARPWTGSDSPFTIPRMGVGRYDSDALFKAKVSGAWRSSTMTHDLQPA